MKNPNIVFLDASTMERGDLDFEILKKLGNFVVYPTSKSVEIPQRIASADIVLSNKAFLGETELSKASQVKMIAVTATGTNNVDLAVAKKRGICVTNVAGYGTQSVAQHAMTFILNWATQVHHFANEVSAWPKSPMFTRLDYPVTEISGKTLGLLGTGKIGNEVGRLAAAFGMTVYAWKRDGATNKDDAYPRLPIRELFEKSDVVSLHCPLNETTKYIINRESLGWMKKGSFLVNTGRGDLVDESALKDALISGHLGGAGLDVLSSEPPPADHPLITLKHPNLMITPHTAWSSHEARTKLLKEVAANIEAFFQGKDRNRIV